MWVAFGAFFLVGIATGSSRAIDTYEDAFLDVAAALLACYFLGPFGGLIAYVVVGDSGNGTARCWRYSSAT